MTDSENELTTEERVKAGVSRIYVLDGHRYEVPSDPDEYDGTAMIVDGPDAGHWTEFGGSDGHFEDGQEWGYNTDRSREFREWVTVAHGTWSHDLGVYADGTGPATAIREWIALPEDDDLPSARNV